MVCVMFSMRTFLAFLCSSQCAIQSELSVVVDVLYRTLQWFNFPPLPMWHVVRHDHSGCADFWTLGIFENFVLFVDVSFIQVDHNSWAQRNTCFRTINNNSHTCNYYSEFTWFAFYYGWSNLFVYIIISIQFNGETTMYECSFKLIVCFFNETSKCSGDVIPKYDEKSPSECHIWPKASNTNM